MLCKNGLFSFTEQVDWPFYYHYLFIFSNRGVVCIRDVKLLYTFDMVRFSIPLQGFSLVATA